MLYRADAWAGIADLSRVCARVIDQILGRAPWTALADDKAKRRTQKLAQGNQLCSRIHGELRAGQFGDDRHVASGTEQHVVSIGGAVGNRLRRNHAVGSRSILDDHLLAKNLRCHIGKKSRSDITRAASGEPVAHPNGTVRERGLLRLGWLDCEASECKAYHNRCQRQGSRFHGVCFLAIFC